MNTNELRIGDIIYVSAKSGNGRKVIRRVGLSEMGHIINNDGCFNYEPIPLTEELLLKCGFKKSPVFGAYYIDVSDELQVYIGTTKRISLINKLDEDEHYSIIQVDSLHQLQNLYFALTGEELEIKIPE